jgi:2-isopropylmalate synthase
VLEKNYPVLTGVHLADYKVRIHSSRDATAATTVVRITSKGLVDGVERQWTTIGVASDIIEASTEALLDAYDWYLFKTGTPAIEPNRARLRGGLRNKIA